MHTCKNRHMRNVLCARYMFAFCCRDAWFCHQRANPRFFTERAVAWMRLFSCRWQFELKVSDDQQRMNVAYLLARRAYETSQLLLLFVMTHMHKTRRRIISNAKWFLASLYNSHINQRGNVDSRSFESTANCGRASFWFIYSHWWM